MPRLRIGTIAASCLLFLAATVASAAAQTANSGAPGKPLPLLQIVHRKSEAKLHPHPKIAAKLARKTRLKRRIAKLAKTHRAVVRAPAPAPAATAALPENIWPAANAGTPNDMALGGTAALAPQSAPAPVSTEPVIDTEPDEIVPNGRIVQAAAPAAVNAPGLTAGNQQPAAQTAVPGSPGAAQVATPVDPVAPKPPAHAMIVKAAAQNAEPASPVGSASWIAHVLAALGGAITAGALAWFLIGPAPRRTYG